MTDDELGRLEELAAGATPGPWAAVCPRVNYRIMAGDLYVMEAGPDGVRTADDAAFIAAARSAVPALVAEVRRLRMELEGAEKARLLLLAGMGRSEETRMELKLELRAAVAAERERCARLADQWVGTGATGDLVARTVAAAIRSGDPPPA
jgi:hypothetical protein